MQRDEGALHAQGVQLVQRGLIEVQAGGGRRDGAGFARVHGLVAGVVAGVGLVRDVGRQRRGAVGVQQVQHRTGKADVEQLALAAQHHGVEGVGQAQPHAGAGRLAGAHVGQGAVGLGDALDQHLDLAAGGLVAVQPGLDDAGVVEDQQVAGPQQAGQVGEAPVMQLAGVIQVQQPAAGAFGGGRLGDELGRQLVVEVGNGERSGHAGIWQERAGGAGRRRAVRHGIGREGRPGRTGQAWGNSLL